MGYGRATIIPKRKPTTTTTTTTSKSKKSKSKSGKEEWRNSPPSAEKWETLQVYKSFVVTDQEGTEYKFMRDDIAAILPNGWDPTDTHELPRYWVGKIKDIRAENYDDSSNSVWAKVQWFYSAKDVSDVVKSFDTKAIGNYERIFSDHYDFLEPEAFEAVVPLYKFNESDPEQQYIPHEQFYRRYTFEYRLRKLDPKPGGPHTCLSTCTTPYNPDDTDASSLMHFCPRPSCRRAYHYGCLQSAKSKESSSTILIPAVRPTSAGKVTVKIPTITVDETIKVTRSARKNAAPPRRPKPKPKSQKDLEEEEDEVLKVVLPPASSGSAVVAELSSRVLRLLACSPDTDDSVDLASLIPKINEDADKDADGDSDPDLAPALFLASDSDPEPPKKKRRGRPPKVQPQIRSQPKSKSQSKKRQSTSTRPSLATVLATLPADLITIAQQPLVRGSAFTSGGVAGNIGMVTKARRLVYQALANGGGYESVPDDWEEMVYGMDREEGLRLGVGLKNAVVKLRGARAIPAFVCPGCKSAI